MTSETLLLVGRDTGYSRDVFETHAERLAGRTAVDEVEVATYESEPVRELRDRLRSVPGDRVYAVPICAAHSHETVDGVPAALSYVRGEVHYCEPLGRSPAVTEVLRERGTDLVRAGKDATIVLVGFGSSSKPYHRQTAEYHAARLRERSAYGEVLTCYLLQNPAVECVRYNISNPRAVAVPLFAARSEATERRVPEELELDRGGIEYAAPLGEHPRITDALQAELEKQRALAADADPTRPSFEAKLLETRRPVATDGEGPT